MQTSPPKRRIIYKPSIVMEGATAAPLLQVASSIAMAALAMLALGSKALLSWSNDLPINRASDLVLVVAQQWHDWMTALGITHVAGSIFDALRWIQAQTW